MITIIIPCYNCENFLSKAISSVFNQTYKDWEIILINNNSTDQTQRVIDELVEQYPERISGFFEEKKGACHARNLGLAHATGEWIQFLDADDELLGDKFTRQLALINEKPGVVIGSFRRVYVEKGYSEEFFVNAEDNIWHSILHSNAGITSANLYQRTAVKNVQGWNVKLTSSQEYDLLFRLLQQGTSISYDTQLSANIYEMANSVSRPSHLNGRDVINKNYLALRIRIAIFLHENNLWNASLQKAYAKRLYEMMLADRSMSLQQANQTMELLGLNTNGFPQLVQRSKYYIKKLMLIR